jgi:protocatechuate 3,4-dioxygenase beta subunit
MSISISISPVDGNNYINAANAAAGITISGSGTDSVLASLVGQTVTVTLNGKTYTGVVQSGGTWSVSVGAADLAAPTNGQSYTVTASVTDAAGNKATATDKVTVQAVSGPPSAATSSITASPATLTANGVATTTLTVTVEDAVGNPVANTAVTLSASGSDNAFSPISGTTNAKGVFTAALTSTLAQTETITATEGSAQETTSVTFAAGPPSASTSSITASPDTVTADGVATTTLTVTVEDAVGNPVANTAVTVSANGSDNVFTPVSGTTNAKGVFTAALTSTLAQTETITATEGSAQ